MKTAVVTGAGRGIGLQIARKLSARGYQVLVTARDPDAGRRAAESIAPSAWSTTLDVRDPAAHHRVAKEASARGPLAVWVNNAGVLVTKKAWEHEPEEIQLLVETNVIGMISGSLAAVKAMGGDGGHILNVASMSGLGPVPGLSVYASTKHAIVGFTTSLQGDLDLAGKPIRVHALCPDATATEMVTGRADEPDAAVLFSGRQLTAEGVADQAIELLGGRRIVHPMPRSRGIVMRCAGLYPEAGLRAMAVVRSIGERRQRS
jgi:short-subunit dehydrogenase